jgi:hypothetical protein
MKNLVELKNAVEKITLNEGLNDTNISFIKIFKSSNSQEILHSIYEPSLFIILQGIKSVMIGDKTIVHLILSLQLICQYLEKQLKLA